MDLLNNLKGGGSGSGSGSGASNSDLMLLRSRMEYVENQLKQINKLLSDLKKQVDDMGAKIGKGGDN